MWAIIARSDARSNVPRASREDVGGPSPATTSSGFVQRGSAVGRGGVRNDNAGVTRIPTIVGTKRAVTNLRRNYIFRHAR